MIEGLLVGAVSVLVIALVSSNAKLRDAEKQLEETKLAARLLLQASEEQVVKFYEFKKMHDDFVTRFEAYRARHDPIDLTREGNVITIGKSSSSNSRD